MSSQDIEFEGLCHVPVRPRTIEFRQCLPPNKRVSLYDIPRVTLTSLTGTLVASMFANCGSLVQEPEAKSYKRTV